MKLVSYNNQLVSYIPVLTSKLQNKKNIFSTHFYISCISHHDTTHQVQFEVSSSYFTVSPSLQVVVQVKPVYTPPQLFPIGKETITYIATDRTGNQANCSFTVTVIGEFILLETASMQTTYAAYDLTWLILVRERKSWEKVEDISHTVGCF